MAARQAETPANTLVPAMPKTSGPVLKQVILTGNPQIHMSSLGGAMVEFLARV